MKLIIKLAFKNLMRGGLRTWLNVIVLSICYVIIVGQKGLMKGMLEQSVDEMTKNEIAGGQYWYKNYDLYDPLSFDDSHDKLPEELKALVKSGQAAPILIRQATIYPHGRVQPILLKGIDPNQKVIGIPTAALNIKEDVLPILIGRHMAESNDLKVGDNITIRWRDSKGTFDAVDGKIVKIMYLNVSTIDAGQFWVPLIALQRMCVLKDEATIVVAGQGLKNLKDTGDWRFKSLHVLMKDLFDIVRTKSIGQSILYYLLLSLALLAIFDTQILSIFRRRKEIGTMMALGMTRPNIIFLFTLEGAMNGFLAMGLAVVYGTPLLALFAKVGMKMPTAGLAIAERVFPSYSLDLVLVTVCIVMIAITIVSFLPSRRISKMKPTDALRGKMT